MIPKDILLVDDNPDDQALTRLALEKGRMADRLVVVVVGDGVEAIDYLFARGAFASRNPRELPAVVLLDLKMPRMDGFEVLRILRAEASTRFLPVIVLTTSNEDVDLVKSYQSGCNSFVRKPVSFDDFAATVNHLGTYWVIFNQSPVPRYGAS